MGHPIISSSVHHPISDDRSRAGCTALTPLGSRDSKANSSLPCLLLLEPTPLMWRLSASTLSFHQSHLLAKKALGRTTSILPQYKFSQDIYVHSVHRRAVTNTPQTSLMVCTCTISSLRTSVICCSGLNTFQTRTSTAFGFYHFSPKNTGAAQIQLHLSWNDANKLFCLLRPSLIPFKLC